MTTVMQRTVKSRRLNDAKPAWMFTEVKCWKCRNHFTVYEDKKAGMIEEYKCPRCGVYNI